MLISPVAKPQPRADLTREALIVAAEQVFALYGFNAAGTRQLAEAAGVNQALISYHFGGKEGLYLAVFERIAAHLRKRLGPIIDVIEEVLAETPSDLPPGDRELRLLPPLLDLVRGMLALMMSQETKSWSYLISREQQTPTAAFTILYDGFMGRALSLMTALVMRLKDGEAEEKARLKVVGILGQCIVWRVARAGIARHLGWDDFSERELRLAQETVCGMVAAEVLR